MKYTEFFEVFMAALYHQTGISGRDWFYYDELLSEYGLSNWGSWAAQLRSDLEEQKLAKFHQHLGGAPDVSVSVTPQGLRYVEDRRGENVAAFLESYGVVFREELSEPQVRSSAPWSIIAGRRITDENREMFQTALAKAQLEIAKLPLSNREMAQIASYLKAAEALAEAPEPPSQMIWRLIERGAAVAGLIAIFIQTFQAFI